MPDTYNYQYKSDPQPKVRPEDQAKIDHLMSADPLHGFGFPGRDTGIIDDPYEVARMRAQDEEIKHKIRDTLQIGDEKSFSKPLADKLFETPKYKDITALVEIDLSTDKPVAVHLRDEIIDTKVNEGENPKDSEYTGFMEAGTLALHPEYKAIFKKAKDMLEDDPSLSVVKVPIQLEGREKMFIGVMRPKVHEPVAELRDRISKGELIEFDDKSGLPLVKDKGTLRAITAEEKEQWNNAYPGEFKKLQRSHAQTVAKFAGVELGEKSTEGGRAAETYFKSGLRPDCTAVIELDMHSGQSKGVHLKSDILATKVTPGADPRLDPDTGFEGAAKIVLGTAQKDYLKQAQDALLRDPRSPSVHIRGELLGQPGKDVTIMRTPLPAELLELRESLYKTIETGVVQGFKFGSNSPTPQILLESKDGSVNELTPAQREAWERSYPGELDKLTEKLKREYNIQKEGARAAGKLVQPRSETEVAEYILSADSRIDFAVVFDPKTQSFKGLSASKAKQQNFEANKDYFECEFDKAVEKKEWKKDFTERFLSNSALKLDYAEGPGGVIVAVINADRLEDIYTHGDISRAVKEGFPTPVEKNKPLSVPQLETKQLEQPEQFEKWVDGYEKFAIEHKEKVATELKSRESRVSSTDRREEAVLKVTPSDREIATNLVHEREDLDFVVILDPGTGNVTAMAPSKKMLPTFMGERASVIDLLDEARWGIIDQFNANPALMIATLPTKDGKTVAVVNKNNASNLFTSGDIQAMLEQWEAPKLAQDQEPLNAQQMFYLQFKDPLMFGDWVESYKNRDDLGELPTVEIAEDKPLEPEPEPLPFEFDPGPELEPAPVAEALPLDFDPGPEPEPAAVIREPQSPFQFSVGNSSFDFDPGVDPEKK